MSKIFRIGFHKTGTKSLGAALENSDYRVCRPVGAKDPDIAKNVFPLIYSLGPYATPFRTIHSHFLTNTLTVAIPTAGSFSPYVHQGVDRKRRPLLGPRHPDAALYPWRRSSQGE